MRDAGKPSRPPDRIPILHAPTAGWGPGRPGRFTKVRVTQLFTPCRCGGTGRRAGLKIRFWQQSVGSIPSTGTKKAALTRAWQKGSVAAWRHNPRREGAVTRLGCVLLRGGVDVRMARLTAAEQEAAVRVGIRTRQDVRRRTRGPMKAFPVSTWASRAHASAPRVSSTDGRTLNAADSTTPRTGLPLVILLAFGVASGAWSSSASADVHSQPDLATTAEDTDVEVEVLANDSQELPGAPGAEVFEIGRVVTPPANGTVDIIDRPARFKADSVRYTPRSNFSGLTPLPIQRSTSRTRRARRRR